MLVPDAHVPQALSFGGLQCLSCVPPGCGRQISHEEARAEAQERIRDIRIKLGDVPCDAADFLSIDVARYQKCAGEQKRGIWPLPNVWRLLQPVRATWTDSVYAFKSNFRQPPVSREYLTARSISFGWAVPAVSQQITTPRSANARAEARACGICEAGSPPKKHTQ